MHVSSSSTIMPPEPMTAPASASESKSTGVLRARGGQAAAQRAAGLDGFELLALRHAAAHVKDDVAQRDAHRDFDQPRVVHLAGQGKDRRPRRLRRADAAEPLRAAEDDLRAPWRSS